MNLFRKGLEIGELLLVYHLSFNLPSVTEVSRYCGALESNCRVFEGMGRFGRSLWSRCGVGWGEGVVFWGSNWINYQRRDIHEIFEVSVYIAW